MEISETRVKLTGNTKDRLKAVCSVTIDGAFVIRDIKVIDGASGLFVAMPSRKLADHCPKCKGKNHLRARFCNDCGARLDENRVDRDRSGRMKLHADIAHPINSECRAKFQAKVVEAFMAEVERSKLPGYRPVQFEDDEEGASGDYAEPAVPAGRSAPSQSRAPEASADGGDHDDLIADLKREAEARHARRSAGANRRPDSDPLADFGAPSEPVRPVEPRRPPEPPPRPEPPRPPEASRPAPPNPSEADDDFGAGLV